MRSPCDGYRLASGSVDHTIKIWYAAGGAEGRTLNAGFGYGVLSVAFSPDGSRLVSAIDQTIKIWDAVSGCELRVFKGHSAQFRSVAFSPDGSRIVSGIGHTPEPNPRPFPGTIKIWDAASGRELSTLKGHTGEVWSVAYGPEGTRLASGSHDQTVKIWDAATGQELRTLKGHTEGVTSVAFSPDGSRVASGSWDHTVKVWDAVSGQELHTLKGHTARVWGVAFSPDGSRLASGGDDHTIIIWDAASGQEVRRLKGHATRVASMAFSPNGSRLASGSDDYTVKVWDVANGQELRTLKGHTGPVTSVAFSPDGWRLASGSWYGTIKLWNARPLTPEVQTEREALGLVEFLFGKPLRKEHVIENVRANQTIRDEVRKQASALAEKYPESALAHQSRGEAHVRSQRWGKAAAEFARAADRRPDDYEYWYYQAIAHLAAGDHKAYQQACARMLERFAKSQDAYAISKLAYTCVPASDSLSDMSVLVPLAEKGAPVFRGNTRIVGAALYRVNKPAEALEQFQRSAKDGFVPRAWDWLFLAMIHHRRENFKEATQCLDKAVRWIEEANQPAEKSKTEKRAVWGHWTEQQEVEALRQEAEALVSGKPVKPKQ
jgi:WD40 repeat protein